VQSLTKSEGTQEVVMDFLHQIQEEEARLEES